MIDNYIQQMLLICSDMKDDELVEHLPILQGCPNLLRILREDCNRNPNNCIDILRSLYAGL